MIDNQDDIKDDVKEEDPLTSLMNRAAGRWRPPVIRVKNTDPMIRYETLPILRTSCYMCDGCDRPSGQVLLVRLQGFYRSTTIPEKLPEKLPVSYLPVSYLFHTDLQTAFWSEPMCLECSIQWTRRYRASIHKKITRATLTLQRFTRRILYSPPTTSLPNGGRMYQKAKDHFEQ